MRIDDASQLPVTTVRTAFLEALERGPVVLSSPTGSGKSTEVPRWCEGPVLVVEPRRIACRSLASRVAQLDGSELGERVGYAVRDERVESERTQILFATPGLVLRDRGMLDRASTVILDEFHERSLEVDLLLALLMRKRPRALVVMSATLEGERVAAHLGGVHLSAEGRAFPVELRYLPGGAVLPDGTDLPGRVQQALDAATKDAGDVLVFLPGKAEITACAQRLRGAFSIVPLHGSLSLDEQRRAFASTRQRKVILATNVAETSLTIPGIGVVIDTGLVRQTRYHEGRAFLALGAIAEDSAAQRMGRAGRTGPGVCYRLWSAAARLHQVTAPAIHRESLVPLVIAAAAWGAPVQALLLLDPPKPYALEAARTTLRTWGALRDDDSLTDAGRGLFALPIDPMHARLLVAAREHGCLEDMIDLVSVLSVGRPLFASGEALPTDAEDLRAVGCDVTAAIGALRAQQPAEQGASSFVVHEARLTRARLRRLENLPEQAARPQSIDRDALVRAAIAADRGLVHVARSRGRTLAFSNGGTEIELARESALRNLRSVDAIVALDTRAFGTGREARVLVTCAMAIPLSVIARAGLGEQRLAAVRLERKQLIATFERVYAGRVVEEREDDTPSGELARQAIVQLLARGSLFREAVKTTRLRLERTALSAGLAALGHPVAIAASEPVPPLEAWFAARLIALGVETGDDLALLSPEDLLAPELPYEVRSLLDQDYPTTISVGDATYEARYDMAKYEVLLKMTKGTRRDPPSLGFLPKFPGLRICVEGPRGLSVVRERGMTRGF